MQETTTFRTTKLASRACTATAIRTNSALRTSSTSLKKRTKGVPVFQVQLRRLLREPRNRTWSSKDWIRSWCTRSKPMRSSGTCRTIFKSRTSRTIIVERTSSKCWFKLLQHTESLNAKLSMCNLISMPSKRKTWRIKVTSLRCNKKLRLWISI